MAINESVRKDVVIKFNNEPCQEIRVWPVWATIGNFRGDNAQGENLSPDNNPAAPLPCPGLGTPPTCTGDPTPQLNGTFNQMELRATISPPGVSAIGTGTQVQFDFKRTLQRKNWVKNANDAQWTLDDEVEAGSPDDPNNGDEDLHDKNDVIWVIDTPGRQEGNATHDFLAIEWQFIETVDLILNEDTNVLNPMGGPLISEEFPWYSIMNLKRSRVRCADHRTIFVPVGILVAFVAELTAGWHSTPLTVFRMFLF